MAPHPCASCGVSSEAAAICSRCKAVWYCNAQCQRTHWKQHKPRCVLPAAAAEAVARAAAAAAPAPAAAPVPAAIKPPPRKPTKAVDASLSELLGGGEGAGGSKKQSASAAKKPSAAAAGGAASAAPIAVTFSLPPASARVEHPLLEVRELPGRGRGFVALKDIEAGTLLLTESSLYAHVAHCNSNEEARIAALAALTNLMLERYPAALEQLCHHADHELPSHPLIDTLPSAAPAGLTLEQWHTALARVDSNCFTSSRGMMCSPTISIANHSCYPNADLIIREVPAPATTTEAEAPAATDADGSAAAAAALSASAASGSASSTSSSPRTVEQCFLYAIEPIASGTEVRINYLGQDSLCRWYAPAMLRQESFESQWQFRCDCNRCEGNKARAIDKTIAWAAGEGMNEQMEERYAKLVLAEHDDSESGGPNPRELLQLYRDIFAVFDGERFYHNYLLHQIRSMLIFMPAAFDSGSGSGAAKSDESEWLRLVEHHLLTLRNNLLNPPLHSIKADTMAVLLRSSDFIGATAAENNARSSSSSGKDVTANRALRRRVVELANEHDEAYFDTPAFATLYPDVFASMQEARAATPAPAS